MEIRHAAVMLHTQSIVDEANQFRDQRDRLAEALRYIIGDSVTFLRNTAIEKADEALQSLTPKP
jgi:hypothetical protein